MRRVIHFAYAATDGDYNTTFSIPDGASVRLADIACPPGTVMTLPIDSTTKLSVCTRRVHHSGVRCGRRRQSSGAGQAALPGLRPEPVHAAQVDYGGDRCDREIAEKSWGDQVSDRIISWLEIRALRGFKNETCGSRPHLDEQFAAISTPFWPIRCRRGLVCLCTLHRQTPSPGYKRGMPRTVPERKGLKSL
jgi:hypothetical protein